MIDSILCGVKASNAYIIIAPLNQELFSLQARMSIEFKTSMLQRLFPKTCNIITMSPSCSSLFNKVFGAYWVKVEQREVKEAARKFEAQAKAQEIVKISLHCSWAEKDLPNSGKS